MTWFSKWIGMHDRLLAGETRQPARNTSPLLVISGVAAVITGWTGGTDLSKLLLASGGFVLGLAAEKFAQRQIRRIHEQMTKDTETKK